MNDGLLEMILARLRPLKEAARFTHGQLTILAILAVLAVSGGLLAARQTHLTPVVKVSGGNPEAAVRARERKPAKKIAKQLLIHVAGDVVNPGLRDVPAGSRVADAIAAAGGPKVGVSLDTLNLAAKVVDGQKIVVGETARSVDAKTSSAQGAVLININEADEAELENLSGVGPVLAARIAEWRARHGGFTKISQLDQIEGIGPKKFAALKDQVTLY